MFLSSEVLSLHDFRFGWEGGFRYNKDARWIVSIYKGWEMKEEINGLMEMGTFFPFHVSKYMSTVWAHVLKECTI